jgi:hypothetical protein
MHRSSFEWFHLDPLQAVPLNSFTSELNRSFASHALSTLNLITADLIFLGTANPDVPTQMFILINKSVLVFNK